jgi:hypothetical protein
MLPGLAGAGASATPFGFARSAPCRLALRPPGARPYPSARHGLWRRSGPGEPGGPPLATLQQKSRRLERVLEGGVWHARCSGVLRRSATTPLETVTGRGFCTPTATAS